MEAVPLFSSSCDHLQYCLRSSNPSLILWALNRLPAECERERRVLQLVPTVMPLLRQPSRLIEFSAIVCVDALLTNFSRNIVASILRNVLDRLEQLPALEYVLCLSKMIPALTDVTLVSCVLPLVDRFLTRADGYQRALGNLLLSVPFSV
jgi:hypothetical protein